MREVIKALPDVEQASVASAVDRLKRTCRMLTIASLVCACATPQNTVETYPERELARQLLARDVSELKDRHGDQFNDLKIVGFDPARVMSSHGRP